MSIELANESGIPVDEVSLLALSRHALNELHIHPLAELSLLLIDADAMTQLNIQWMDATGPTDVLAFPMDELRPSPGDPTRGAVISSDPPPELLGDIVLCPQVAAIQASQAGHNVTDELRLLCVHGILHLLGYDHAEDAERAVMFALQQQLLDSWAATEGGSP
jgi:probable rRNA maturation factor